MVDPFDLIGRGDIGGLRAALSANPSLTKTRAVSGASLLAHAAYMGSSEAIKVVRAANPTLDPYEAIILGDVDRVKDLLANHWDANERAPDGFTSLALAAFFKQPDIFDLLLPLTADVNAQAENPQKVAALHAATAQRQTEMVEKLLRAGATPDLEQADGFTPLHVAAQHGDTAIVALLLLFGADPRKKNAKGQDAVDHARAGGHEWLAKLLTDR